MGKSYEGEGLIILEENQKDTYEKYAAHKIVIKGIEMSSHHILALSGLLVTFGQQK